jgi:glycosyltransferase involved in cell wall biosynthesis
VRILFVTHSYPRHAGDAAGAFILRLAQGLQAAGDEVRVLAPADAGLAPEGEIGGVPVRRFRYAPRSWETLAYRGTMAEQVGRSWRGKAALAGLLARGAAAVRAEVSSFSPDVVHAHWWFPAGLMATGARLRVPLVTTMHGSDVRLARTKSFAAPLLRLVVSRSSAVTAVSHWLAGEARAMAPGLDASVEPMPVDTTLFTPAPAHDRARFVFVGRLNAQKGIMTLIEALATSATGASLDVVGGGDREAADALIKRLGLGGRVTVHGPLPQEEVVPLYQAATATIVPSEDEGLGLVAVESMLCETPVIAFRSGGITDVVVDGETGVLTPPGDIAALAAAMDAMVRDADRAAAFGHAGRRAAVARFTLEKVASRYRAIYLKATVNAER